MEAAAAPTGAAAMAVIVKLIQRSFFKKIIMAFGDITIRCKVFAIGMGANNLIYAMSITYKSGWADSNRRPHGPEPCALTGLSHAPNY